MAVTELAIIPLSHPLTEANPLIQKLKVAKSVLETKSGYPFHYFQQIEDPSIIYTLGKWDSVAAHAAFLPSAENQDLLRLLKDDISASIDRQMKMWHLDGDIFSVKEGERDVLQAPTVSLSRHFVPIEKKAGFMNKFVEVKGLLEDYTTTLKVVGGWRIEKESIGDEEREEWALFSGFDSVEAHMGFAKTKGFEKYREIVEFVESFEVRHLARIEGL
ncbi:hypothetical protein B0O99DRAFT_539224 [Bisporella sp. PMI_857]|nr:hypothetical protein B0O99DRAFT_539224 [Bisporella sp. PMI_857]